MADMRLRIANAENYNSRKGLPSFSMRRGVSKVSMSSLVESVEDFPEKEHRTGQGPISYHFGK
jgi:hypothetical protein